MIVFSHPTGNANVRAAVTGFLNAGTLCEFDTAIASFEGTLLDKLSSIKQLSEIRRRNFDPALKKYTHTFPWYETARLIALRLGIRSLVHHETGPFCIDSVYRHHDEHVAKRIATLHKNVDAVYAYEDGCISSFRMAKKFGIRCNFDLPIGYWRASKKILDQEKIRWPQWESTLVGVKNSSSKLARKDEELGMADSIYVASSFTAKTLLEYHGSLPPVNVIPYGFPAVGKQKDYFNGNNSALKLLFVGGLSQRKGIADLFGVVSQLKNYVSLTVVGHKPSIPCQALDNALKGVNYIPSLPHDKILKLMRDHDVLVFPSVFEGFGLVITEAMSQGTPVITTYNTAGADLIEDGKNGWLIDAASTEQLQISVERLLNNRDLIANCGLAAMSKARERPWKMYGKELAEAVNCPSVI